MGRILVWNGVFRQVGSSIVQVGIRVGRDLFFNWGAPIDGLGRLDWVVGAPRLMGWGAPMR